MSRVAYCAACAAIESGIRSRIPVEHTCGLPQSEWPVQSKRKTFKERLAEEQAKQSAEKPAVNNNTQLPVEVVQKILKARDALVVGEPDEAYHQLYGIASPGYDSYYPWRDMELQTNHPVRYEQQIKEKMEVTEHATKFHLLQLEHEKLKEDFRKAIDDFRAATLTVIDAKEQVEKERDELKAKGQGYFKDQITSAIWEELREADHTGKNNDRAYEIIGVVTAALERIKVEPQQGAVTDVFVPCSENDPRSCGGYSSNDGQSLCYVREAKVPVIQTGSMWVKAIDRLPDSWHLKCARFIHTKTFLLDPDAWLKENERAIQDVEWLDESGQSKEGEKEVMP